MSVKKAASAIGAKRITTAIKAGRMRSVRSGNDKLSTYIKPMLAQIHDHAFDDPDWIFEIKWDGYRAVAEVRENGVKFDRAWCEQMMELHDKTIEKFEKRLEDSEDAELKAFINKTLPVLKKHHEQLTAFSENVRKEKG